MKPEKNVKPLEDQDLEKVNAGAAGQPEAPILPEVSGLYQAGHVGVYLGKTDPHDKQIIVP